jgi:hypothetical protein
MDDVQVLWSRFPCLSLGQWRPQDSAELDQATACPSIALPL